MAPLLPARPPRRLRYPGRLPADDRAALRGIAYVLCKGVSWRDVPAERVGCSGVTAWRRLRDWTEAGVWPQLHEVLLSELRAAGLLDMNDAAQSMALMSGLSKGGSHRTFAGRPRTSGQQAPPDRRPARHPLGYLADRR
ncbi:transposase [Streptomyces sp. NPDC057486]|uniref:transposase n=1 Tax=Streptomyces sp. NPDC057486 TaxID=3346145 RepID=UPI0036B9C207